VRVTRLAAPDPERQLAALAALLGLTPFPDRGGEERGETTISVGVSTRTIETPPNGTQQARR